MAPLQYPMSMTVRISGESFNGKRETLNAKPLTEYSADEVQAMVDSSVACSIFLKDESRADEARSILSDFFSHYKGTVISKATEFGWVVTQSLLPTRDDSVAFAGLRQSKAS